MSEANCPKCTNGVVYATNIFDNSLHLPKSEQNVLSMRAVVREPVAIRRLVCVGCGYLETYVVDHDFLKQVPRSSAWIKV
jgi:ribosomal protein S27AE